MKAFVVEHYGKDGLRAADVPEPEVGDGDVLVKVSAASINPLDTMVRNGEFKRLLKYRTPFVLGHDVAGVVTRVGSAVRDFQVGGEVYAAPATCGSGPSPSTSRSTRTTSRPSQPRSPRTRRPRCRWCHWPPGRPSSTAPTCKPGQKVLVHAGSGGLGSTVIQLAKHLSYRAHRRLRRTGGRLGFAAVHWRPAPNRDRDAGRADVASAAAPPMLQSLPISARLERDLGADHDGAVAGQPEGVDRARGVAGHRDEEPLAPGPQRARGGRGDRDARDEVGGVLEVEVALEQALLATQAQRAGTSSLSW